MYLCILFIQSEREPFEVHVYGHRIMKYFVDNNKNIISFAEFCEGKEHWEVCRYFFACLHLVSIIKIKVYYIFSLFALYLNYFKGFVLFHIKKQQQFQISSSIYRLKKQTKRYYFFIGVLVRQQKLLQVFSNNLFFVSYTDQQEIRCPPRIGSISLDKIRF